MFRCNQVSHEYVPGFVVVDTNHQVLGVHHGSVRRTETTDCYVLGVRAEGLSSKKEEVIPARDLQTWTNVNRGALTRPFVEAAKSGAVTGTSSVALGAGVGALAGGPPGALLGTCVGGALGLAASLWQLIQSLRARSQDYAFTIIAAFLERLEQDLDNMTARQLLEVFDDVEEQMIAAGGEAVNAYSEIFRMARLAAMSGGAL